MDYYRTNGLPEQIPGLVRVTADGRWERWQYGQGFWTPAASARGYVKHSGDWEPCAEQDVVAAIAARPPDRPTSLTPRELATLV